jgi:hypothetical protein
MGADITSVFIGGHRWFISGLLACCGILLATGMARAGESQYTLHHALEPRANTGMETTGKHGLTRIPENPEPCSPVFIRGSEACPSVVSVPAAPLFTPAWTRFAAPPADSARSTHACCYDSVNDRFYLIGGTPLAVSGTYVDLCQRYDPNTDAWTPMAHMPNPKGWIKGLYARGKIYVIGGQSNMNSALNENAVYDPATDSWVQKVPCPTATIAYEGAVYRDSLLYIMGGTPDGTHSLCKVQIYNILTNSWTTGDSLRKGCQMGDACIIGDTIYFAGGFNANVDTVDSMMRKGAINPHDPTKITWSWGPRLPAPRGNGPTVVCRGKVYWIAGDGSYGGHSTQRAFVYTPGDTMIDSIPSYPYAATECCWAASRSPIPQIFGFCGYASPDTGYFKISFSPVTHDVGVTQITQPGAEADSGDTVTPCAVIRNYGLQAEGFRVMMRIDSSYVDYEDVIIDTGKSVSAVFAPWPATRRGLHIAKCSTMLASDSDHLNDILTESFLVGVTQFGVSSWTVPAGAVDSGYPYRPSAVIHDSGTVPVRLGLVLRIQPDYVARESIDLPVGSDSSITFPIWTPLRLGSWPICCSLVTGPHLQVFRDSVLIRIEDGGVTRIRWPSGNHVGPGPVVPWAEIHNYGTATEDIPAAFEIQDTQGGSVYSYMATAAALAPDSSEFVPFIAWNADTGTYRSFAFTVLSGDRNPANDSQFNRFRVVPNGVDFGELALVPGETIPAGSVEPSIKLMNFGNGPINLAAVCGIFRSESLSVYASDTAQISNLNPGADSTVRFSPAWPATAGQYLTRFITFADHESCADTVFVPVKVTGAGAVDAASPSRPTPFALDAPAPNPFSTQTVIRFALPAAADISLKLYDVAGQCVAILAQGPTSAGPSSFVVRRSSVVGHARLGPGVYLLRLEAAGAVRSRTLIIE